MYKVNNSVSQDGELLKEDHKVKNSLNQSFQPFSGGMVLVVGRNSEKYFIACNMHLKTKQKIKLSELVLLKLNENIYIVHLDQSSSTPPRTPRISGLKFQVLKSTFLS